MNKVYKIVWNKALGVWVVVSELAKAGKKSSKVTVVGGILVLSAVQLSHAEMVITDSNGTSIIAGDGLYIENGPTLSREVFDANGLYLANLADGLVTASSQDGINGSQLYNSMSNVATAIGKSALIDSNTGEITVRNVAGTNQNTIDDAISFVKTTADNALKTANLGLNFSTNGANPSNIPLGGMVDFSNGKNTTATYNSSTKSYQYSVVDAPNFAGKVTAQGFDASNQVISNVANGVAPNDAVNVAQLKAQQTHYYSVNDNGSTGANYNNETAKDVKADNVQAKNVTADNVKVGNVTVNSTTNKVSGLANGEVSKTSTDAVNGSQLHATNQNMATYLGGGSTVNTDGSTSAPTYNVAGGSYHDVGSALNAVDGRVSNLEQAFYQTNQNMQDLRNETRAGIAGALAVGNLPQPTEAGMSMISAGVGGYRGETAVAVGVSAITDSNKYVWKMGASADSRSNISGAVSVGYQWK